MIWNVTRIFWNAEGGAGGGAVADSGAAGTGTSLSSGTGVAAAEGAAPVVDTGAAQDWTASLPDDLKNHEAILRLKDGGVEALARSHVNAQKFIGRDPNEMFAKPKDEAEFRGVMQKLGLPEQATDYKLELPQDYKAPQGFEIDKPVGQAFLAAAHEAGILPKQATAIYAKVTEMMSGFETSQREAIAAKETELDADFQKEFGAAAKHTLASAAFAADKMGLTTQEVDALPAETRHKMIRALAKTAAFFQEDQTGFNRPSGTAGFGNGPLSPSQAQAKAQELSRASIAPGVSQAESRRLAEEASRYWRIAQGS